MRVDINLRCERGKIGWKRRPFYPEPPVQQETFLDWDPFLIEAKANTAVNNWDEATFTSHLLLTNFDKQSVQMTISCHEPKLWA